MRFPGEDPDALRRRIVQTYKANLDPETRRSLALYVLAERYGCGSDFVKDALTHAGIRYEVPLPDSFKRLAHKVISTRKASAR